jgi:uncharacterized protein (TIGR02453 family)
MPAISIQQDTLDFLKDLSDNNNREWFNACKNRYLEAHNNIVDFADALIIEMNRHDRIETPSGKKSLFRIYKDVRFSKDKTPYNTHWSGAFRRATRKLRGGYYFRIAPGDSFLAGGFFGPVSDDMKRIREDIDLNTDDWRAMLANKTLAETFGKLRGHKLTKMPYGYQKDHPAIDLLRHKQFLFKLEFTDAEVLDPDFLYRVNNSYRNLRPFFDYMSEVLTTDANGISLF